MKQKKILLCIGFFLSVMLFNTNVYAAIDSNAATVLLRTSCNENGATIDNCFDDLNTLNSWVWNTRYPSPTSPLKVDVGPGTFTGSFTCNGSGFVTISGAGMGNTVIQNGSSPISTTQCVNLVFSDMTLKNTGTLFGVRNAGGTTVWSNIEIIGLGYAWFDTPGGCSGAPGTHYWFGSRITAETTASNSATAYFNACDKTWFYGSEITAKGTVGSSTPLVAVGGEVHVYGSNIRAIPADGASMATVTAVTAANTAEIHIHGTGIDVISSAANNITALSAENGGSIHANESSYVMKTGSGGLVTRISNSGGNIAAPYQWQVSATPPAINSLSGYDTVIYTGTGDGHPHLAVYDSSCAGDWYDINTSSCL
jgi:hypothetical protein